MTQIEQLTSIISQARREMQGVYASADDIDRAIAERLVEKGAVLLPEETRLAWIDNADSYICPLCRLEVSSPAKYKGCRCPRCGFVAAKDIGKS